MIEKRLLPVRFAGGLDTKTDPKQVMPGKFLDLQNAVFQQTGMVNRRWGYKALGRNIAGSSALISSTAAIEAFNKELLLFDGLNAYSYIAANDNWATRGSVVSVIQTNKQVIANNNQQLSPDFGTLGGVEVYAWEDSRGGIRYSVLDAASGTIIVADKPLYTGALATDKRPKVIAWNGQLRVFFLQAANTIAFVSINPSNPTASNASATVLLNSVDATLYYDVAVNASNLLAVAYIQIGAFGGSGRALTVATFTAAFANLGTVRLNTGNLYGVLNVSTDAAGAFWILYTLTTGPQANMAYFTNGALQNGPFAVINPTPGAIASVAGVAFADPASSNGYSLRVFVESTGSQTYHNLILTNTVTQSGTAGSPIASAPVFARSVGLASKPFQYAGATYINVAFQSQQQATYFTLDASGKVVAKVFPSLAGGLIQNSDSMLPECPAVAPGIFKYANLVRALPNAEAGTIFALLGVNATKLDFSDSNQFLSEPINGCLYTVGGVLQTYDGAAYVEQGFHVYPEAYTLTPSASGGSMATGTYFYAITYEWNNNLDQTDISTLSLTQSVAVTGPTGSVSILVPTLRLTKKSGVKIVIYRTTVGGTLLYRVTSAVAPFYNDPTVDTLTFVDTLADASITANGLCYTQPLTIGSNPVVPNSAPPSCSLIASFANRLFVAGLDDGYSLWYSQQQIPNSPAQFSSLLKMRIDPDGGVITALQRMDDKLYIFKANAIFYITGQGPTATGDLNDFGSPIVVPSGEVGCVSQNTIVLTPMGILFQSANGIYLLDRAGNVSYKGAPVEAYNALAITSATLIPNQWVVFTTTTGPTLVYDYYYDQWSTFTNHAAIDSTLFLGQGNLFTYANAAGQVYLQTPTTFTDAGVPIKFSATMAWLSFAGLQGYQRVYHALLLGTYKGSHNLNVWVGYDYDEPFTALAQVPVDATLGVNTFGSASPFGIDSPFGGVGPGQSVYQFRFDLLRKCQALRLKFEDLESAPGNEGFSLSALSLVVGVKRGANKLPAAKQFGAA